MAQETGTVTGAKDQHPDHIDEDEVSELQKTHNFYDRVREQAERFASTRIGQFVIERSDRALRMIEDTAKWSLPQGEPVPIPYPTQAALKFKPSSEKSDVPLERPLPWGPFLLLIVLLRLTRIWLSVAALMIGNGPISPSDMVYFIQTRRRKLRAIRVQGLKVLRQRQQEAGSYGSGKGLTQKLTQWFSRAMCRPGVQRANSGRLFTVRNMEQTTQTSPAVHKRPREEEGSTEADHNLTIEQMLAKYANENSEDDSDFVPNPEEEEETSSSSDSSSESHSSEEISSDEAERNANQDKPKTGGSAVVENGVHKAEDKENKDQGKLNAKPAPAKPAPKSAAVATNGNNDKEQADLTSNLSLFLPSFHPRPHQMNQSVNQRKEEDQWKSSPGHVSAAKMDIRLLNNTAAAASTDPQPDLQPEPVSQTQTDPQPQSQTENDETEEEDDDESCTSTSGSSQTGSTVYQRDPVLTPIPDPQAEQILELAATLTAQQLSNNYPIVDTLTPATSSEDIFYSPIGSPTCFNTSLGTQALLKNASIQSVLHSTPTSELKNPATESPKTTLPENSEPEPTQPQSQQSQHQHQPQNHQNHQRQNHSHQRYRGGRNRR
ncbi:hypothetical protein KR009_003341 [Drosophila setifemur]|nr:hypothetical protein KR009_003341 [Drosophila setifemur]